ncbi:MAG: hypothetical protein AAFO15_02035 [Pseudomonadota bacterium]
MKPEQEKIIKFERLKYYKKLPEFKQSQKESKQLHVLDQLHFLPVGESPLQSIEIKINPVELFKTNAMQNKYIPEKYQTTNEPVRISVELFFEFMYEGNNKGHNSYFGATEFDKCSAKFNFTILSKSKLKGKSMSDVTEDNSVWFDHHCDRFKWQSQKAKLPSYYVDQGLRTEDDIKPSLKLEVYINDNNKYDVKRLKFSPEYYCNRGFLCDLAKLLSGNMDIEDNLPLEEDLVDSDRVLGEDKSCISSGSEYISSNSAYISSDLI